MSREAEMKIRVQMIIKNKYNEILEEEIKYFSKSYAVAGIKRWFSGAFITKIRIEKTGHNWVAVGKL